MIETATLGPWVVLPLRRQAGPYSVRHRDTQRMAPMPHSFTHWEDANGRRLLLNGGAAPPALTRSVTDYQAMIGHLAAISEAMQTTNSDSAMDALEMQLLRDHLDEAHLSLEQLREMAVQVALRPSLSASSLDGMSS